MCSRLKQMNTDTVPTVKIEKLAYMLHEAPGYCVLTGAGCSTASGLPAYRNHNGEWQHDRPMEHRDFVSTERMRKIYWARSQRGWPAFSHARPNQIHKMLAAFQQSGHLNRIITQNVDRLHQAAGSRRVIDLHGRLDRVICLDCSADFSRHLFQQRLELLNHPNPPVDILARPDGDAETGSDIPGDYKIPECESCGGRLKPDVVFFGGILNPQTAADALQAVDTAPGLLVVGSSLMVYSGYRLVKRAIQQDKPVVIINLGATRADDLYTLKISHEAGQVLTEVRAVLAKIQVSSVSLK